MPRFRRYRVFVFSAVVILFLLYRVAENSGWENSAASSWHDNSFIQSNADVRAGYKPANKPAPPAPAPAEEVKPPAEEVNPKPEKSPLKEKVEEEAQEAKSQPPPPPPPPPPQPQTVRIPELKTDLEVEGEYALPAATRVSVPTKAAQAALAGMGDLAPKPTQDPLASSDVSEGRPENVGDSHRPSKVDEIHIMKPPGARQRTSRPATTTVYWTQMPEHFPIPDESIIPLPTGKPRLVPTIQYDFDEETESARNKRESRLDQVKAEMKRTWAGYRKYAWGHDELTPVSNKFRDPFCGWAATLVDSLDTLWIMDMRDEFDEAYEAVQEIDFTTTPYRTEIPVFETTIRYLGGLIAAFDITGGHSGQYPALLDKAVELAEILMGVFDTPNRMPVLYYNWNPAYASQPKRAATASGIAELGTLSMEFTRLAQLTGVHKYYDAVARITDVLEELQNREGGTTLPGIFPQNLDASGCNRTKEGSSGLSSSSERAKAQAEGGDAKTEPKGYTPSPANPQELKKDHLRDIAGRQDESADSTFSASSASKASPSSSGEGKPEPVDDEGSQFGKRELPRLSKPVKNEDEDGSEGASVTSIVKAQNPKGKHAGPFKANGEVEDWDCSPQPLVRSPHVPESYSMGGSQDSAYEYFPKQYLLLGGLEPKYQEMHEKTIEAVKEFLLYRPMIPDEDRDILFSSKIVGRIGSDDMAQTFEATHLTCFLGGMFGLGGRIFDRPEDVEIGKRLADGCVWAYDAMPSGIMPESSTLAPCADKHNCAWNETLWREMLDPQFDRRNEAMVKWEKKHAQWENDVAKAKGEEALRLAAEEEAMRQATGDDEVAKFKLENIHSKPGRPPMTEAADSIVADEDVSLRKAAMDEAGAESHSSTHDATGADAKAGTKVREDEEQTIRKVTDTHASSSKTSQDKGIGFGSGSGSDSATSGDDEDSTKFKLTDSHVAVGKSAAPAKDGKVQADDGVEETTRRVTNTHVSADSADTETIDTKFLDNAKDGYSMETGSMLGDQDEFQAATKPRPMMKRDLAAEDNTSTAPTADEIETLEKQLDLNHPSPSSPKYKKVAEDATATLEEKSKVDDQVPIKKVKKPTPNKSNANKPKVPSEPIKPLSHEEFVNRKIKSERLQPGFTTVGDKRYILRPEAIESVWYMYRITGDTEWQERGWRMFSAILAATRTPSGASAISDVTHPDIGSIADPKENGLMLDTMESFWPAETLKYFYLLYTTPDVISLDEWVLNTEAHPFKRPT